ncbi:hypothetical protein YC2023_059791 [Brassica napus]
MVSSAGYVASSDVIVGSGGWFPGPLKRRGGVLPILLKSGDRFDGLFDTEMSCGPLYAGEYGPRFSFWLVKGYGELSCSCSVDLLISDSPILSLPCSSARWRRPSLLEVRPLGVIVRFLSSLTQVGFIACHGFPIFCFSKSVKGIAIVVLVVAVSLLSPVHIPVPSLKEVFGGEFRSVFGDEGEGVQLGFWMHESIKNLTSRHDNIKTKNNLTKLTENPQLKSLLKRRYTYPLQ